MKKYSFLSLFTLIFKSKLCNWTQFHISSFSRFSQQYRGSLLLNYDVCNHVSKYNVSFQSTVQNVTMVRNITCTILDVNQPEESGNSARRGAQHWRHFTWGWKYHTHDATIRRGEARFAGHEWGTFLFLKMVLGKKAIYCNSLSNSSQQ